MSIPLGLYDNLPVSISLLVKQGSDGFLLNLVETLYDTLKEEVGIVEKMGYWILSLANILLYILYPTQRCKLEKILFVWAIRINQTTRNRWGILGYICRESTMLEQKLPKLYLYLLLLFKYKLLWCQLPMVSRSVHSNRLVIQRSNGKRDTSPNIQLDNLLGGTKTSELVVKFVMNVRLI